MTNSYHEGFSKTAAEHGVDPDILLKFAQNSGELGTWDKIKALGGAAWKAVTNPSKAIDKAYDLYQNSKVLSGPEGKKVNEILQNPTVKSIINGAHGAMNWWENLDPNMKRGLGGMALTGLGSMLFTDGNLFQRLIKGLGYGTLGGAAAYGISRSGLYDKGINYLAKNWGTPQQSQQSQAALPPPPEMQSALAEQNAAATPGAFLTPENFSNYATTAKAMADQRAFEALMDQTTP